MLQSMGLQRVVCDCVTELKGTEGPHIGKPRSLKSQLVARSSQEEGATRGKHQGWLGQRERGEHGQEPLIPRKERVRQGSRLQTGWLE